MTNLLLCSGAPMCAPLLIDSEDFCLRMNDADAND